MGFGRAPFDSKCYFHGNYLINLEYRIYLSIHTFPFTLYFSISLQKVYFTACECV